MVSTGLPGRWLSLKVLTLVLVALLIEVLVTVVVVVEMTPGAAEAAAKLVTSSPILGGDALSEEVTATA